MSLYMALSVVSSSLSWLCQSFPEAKNTMLQLFLSHKFNLQSSNLLNSTEYKFNIYTELSV